MNGRRILIVEDEPLIALGIEELLLDAGAEVVGPAHSVEIAKELVTASHLSAAILDIRVGDEEVWPVARLLAESGVPFFFYSAHFTAKTLPADLAGHRILAKPARSNEIIAAFADLMVAQ